tara:strand:+ start:23 stop:3334 length:3312 start_codon:yes stop_codon:yes gene_type:complete
MPISKIVLDNQSKENVDFDGNFIRLPHGSTAQRPSSPENGHLRYNTDFARLEQYAGGVWQAIDSPPAIVSLAHSGSLTAADPAGGETITLTGTNFQAGATVTVGGTTANSVAVTSSSTITFTTPAKAAGDYDVVVTNSNGLSARLTNGISYNGLPAFTTPAGNVGSIFEDDAMATITIVAAEPDGGTLAFSVTSGALPTGVSLGSANGQLTGTPNVNVTADTTYNFTVTATDDENQTNSRAFNLIVLRPVYIKQINKALKMGWSANNTNLSKSLTGSKSTYTISMWVKKWHDRGTVGTSTYLWSASSGTGTLNECRDNNAIDQRGTFNSYDTSGGGRGTHSEADSFGGDWQHLVWQVNSGTAKLYVNGVEDPRFTDSFTALSGTFRLGSWHNEDYIWHGAFAEIHFVDGQALTPSTFGVLYNDTWTPIEVTLTTSDYGTDGFHLDFADGTNYGNDVSGNNNDLTVNNMNDNDYHDHDTPTKDAMILQANSGNGDRNRIKWGSYVYGYYNGGNYTIAHGNWSVNSGKWYFETQHVIQAGSGNTSNVGWFANDWGTVENLKTDLRLDNVGTSPFVGLYIDSYNDVYRYIKPDGQANGSNVSSSFTNSTVWGCAVDFDTGKMWWSADGTWLDGDPAAGTGAPIEFDAQTSDGYHTTGNENKNRKWTPIVDAASSSSQANQARIMMNFGWIGNSRNTSTYTDGANSGFVYAPPTGFKSLRKDNLPEVNTTFTPRNGTSTDSHFDVVTYRGDGTTNNTKSIATTCQPDMVWLKGRESGFYYRLYSQVLKSGNDLIPWFGGVTAQAVDYGTNDSIQVSSNAFTLGQVSSGGSGDARGGVNSTGVDHIACCWKLGGAAVTNPNGTISSTISANTTTQISSVLYTGTNAAGTVGHGLSGPPDFAMISEIGGSSNYNHWGWSRHLSGTSGGAGFWSGINTTNNWDNGVTTFHGGVTNTTVGWTASGQYGNESGKQFNIFFFREVEGFSSIGFYHGNGYNVNPPEVKTGFRPKMILIKSVEGSGNWVIHTDQQDFNYNERPLFLNLSNQEGTETGRGIIFLSDGFRINNLGSPNADMNTDNIKYFYMAFAAHPTKYSASSFFSDFSTSQNLTA